MKIKASEAVPGQWYEDHLGRRFLCIDPMRAYYHEVGFFSINANEDLTHLPDCTGWDWQPPKPEKRYRAFASFQEWWPHRERWVRRDGFTAIVCYRQEDCESLFETGTVFVNDDGSDGEPFGVEVSE